MTKKFARIRASVASKARQTNIHLLLSEMKLRPMRSRDMADFLSISISGARSYLDELLLSGLIVLSHKDGQIPSFRAVEDNSVIKDYFERINDAETIRAQKLEAKRQRVEEQARLEGRRVHIMMDDSAYSIKLNSTSVKRDPWIFNIFGDGPAPSLRNA